MGRAVRIAQLGAVLLHITDGAEIIDLAILAQRDMVFLRLAEGFGEGQLAVVVEGLLGEMQEGIFIDGGANFRQRTVSWQMSRPRS